MTASVSSWSVCSQSRGGARIFIDVWRILDLPFVEIKLAENFSISRMRMKRVNMRHELQVEKQNANSQAAQINMKTYSCLNIFSIRQESP